MQSLHLSHGRQRTRLLIEGYIHDISKLLPNLLVPVDICILCYQYYRNHYVGLTNPGYLDCLISVLQILYMTPQIRHTVFKWQYNAPPNAKLNFKIENRKQDTKYDYNALPDKCLPFQLQCLFARLNKSNRFTVSLNALTDCLDLSVGTLGIDGLMDKLMNTICDFMSLENCFIGKWLDYIDCVVCNAYRYIERPFEGLSLTLKEDEDLVRSIKRFLQPELLTGNNQVHCKQCNQKQNALKGLKLKQLPHVLIITLQRFSFSVDSNWLRKVKYDYKVMFPNELNMKQFLDDDILKQMDNKEHLMYSLYAVILHSGGAMGGVYFDYIKPFDDNEWYKFAYSSVKPINDDEFKKAYGGEKCSGNAYMLFYRQKNLTMPKDYGYFPTYLEEMIKREDKMSH
eukprot:107022_1